GDMRSTNARFAGRLHCCRTHRAVPVEAEQAAPVLLIDRCDVVDVLEKEGVAPPLPADVPGPFRFWFAGLRSSSNNTTGRYYLSRTRMIPKLQVLIRARV